MLITVKILFISGKNTILPAKPLNMTTNIIHAETKMLGQIHLGS